MRRSDRTIAREKVDYIRATYVRDAKEESVKKLIPEGRNEVRQTT